MGEKVWSGKVDGEVRVKGIASGVYVVVVARVGEREVGESVVIVR